jgi:outer membrane protein TolC
MRSAIDRPSVAPVIGWSMNVLVVRGRPFARRRARARPGSARRIAPLALAMLALAACATGTPRLDGEPGAPASPASLWPVPAKARTPVPTAEPPAAPEASAALDADVGSGAAGAPRQLSLTDVVDLALRNNPATRESWALARSAASSYGASRGVLFPSLDAGVDLTRSVGRTTTIGGASGGTGGVQVAGGTTTRTQLAPTVTLSYLVFDLGGRAGTIEAAKQRAIAADLTHNATVQNTVLQVESSLFSFLATRALRDAQVVAVNESRADVAAAEERERVGVATIADVLQTRTALAQARFQLATLEGNLMGARGQLATAMGLPANARFEVPDAWASDSVSDVTTSVDTLIARAIANRPELSELRAEASALAAEIRVARAAGYPALTLRSSAGYTRSSQSNLEGRNGSIALGFQIPIFNGLARQYDVSAAREQYEAGLARVATMRQQVSLQVFTSYYALRAAAGRVRAAADLLASAQRSADVAAGRYREGVGTITDVLLARSALETARAEAIQARWEWSTSLAQLAHDAGALDAHGRTDIPLADSTGNRR